MEQSEVEAKNWFEKAAEQGEPSARKALQQLDHLRHRSLSDPRGSLE